MSLRAFEVVEQEYSEHYADDPTPRYMVTYDDGFGDAYMLCAEMSENHATWLAAVLNDFDQRPGTWV